MCESMSLAPRAAAQKEERAKRTRQDTRLPQSHAGGKGQRQKRSLGHLDRSSELKKRKNAKKVKRGLLDGQTGGLTKRGIESRSTRLKIGIKRMRKKEREGRGEGEKEGNKAGYTVTLVACRWAGAVMEKVYGAFGQEM